MSERLELEINAMSHDGRGIAARGEGELVTFVSGALPGERVLAEIVAEKKGFREARTYDVLAPMPDAVTPPCPHADECGGCPLMRMPYEKQLFWKGRILGDAISRLGGLRDVEIAPVVASPKTLDFRNKIELSFGTDKKGALVLGMRRRLAHDIVATPSCRLLPRGASSVIPLVRDVADELGLSVWKGPLPGSGRPGRSARKAGPGDGRGLMRFCTVRTGIIPDSALYGQGDEQNAVWVVLLTSPSTTSEKQKLRKLAERILAESPEVHAVIHEERASEDMLTAGEARRFTLCRQGERGEASRLMLPLAGRLYMLDAAGFFQVNAEAAEILARTAASHVLPGDFLDLYCGVGAPGLSCVKDGRVTGLEYSKEAVRCAADNAERFGIRASYSAGDAAKRFAALTRGRSYPQVLCDPPRGGLAANVAEGLLDMAPSRITYISCNPATLARDARILAHGYELKSVVPIDLFPHTPHVESVSLWERKG